MRLDAGCCEFLVYRIVTDKAVQLIVIFSSVIAVMHGSSASSADFLSVGSARVTLFFRKKPTDASVIPLLVWKFFCKTSTSLSFFSETRNNNRQIVFCEKPFLV